VERSSRVINTTGASAPQTWIIVAVALSAPADDNPGMRKRWVPSSSPRGGRPDVWDIIGSATIRSWLIMLMLMFSGAQAFSAPEPSGAAQTFPSGGKDIRVETFVGPAGEAAPSIIVLHGSTGVDFANRFIAGIAQNFAAKGFVVHLVHYFDRTGTRYADDETIRRSSAAWLATVHDAVKFVRAKRPNAPIGIFGYSLGGYLAAAEMVNDDVISAAVILSGGLDEGSARTAHHTAPTLILHGSADARVPVSEAQKLEAFLKRAGRAPEMHIYPNEGHIMTLPTYDDVVKRGAEFLRQNLQKSPR
jgi:carboxymethylenebutenolidase